MDFLKEIQEKSAEIVAHLKGQLSGVRGGRPTTKLVEDVTVDYAGATLLVRQLGSVSVAPPRDIYISVWDHGAAGAVATAIEAAIKATARVDGGVVKVSLPPLSEERRNELVKIVKRETEEAKIKVRAVRDEVLKNVKQEFDEKKIGEDERFRLKEQIQKRIDAVNADIESALELKIRELHE